MGFGPGMGRYQFCTFLFPVVRYSVHAGMESDMY